jgi:hypothetical protein
MRSRTNANRFESGQAKAGSKARRKSSPVSTFFHGRRQLGMNHGRSIGWETCPSIFGLPSVGIQLSFRQPIRYRDGSHSTSTASPYVRQARISKRSSATPRLAPERRRQTSVFFPAESACWIPAGKCESSVITSLSFILISPVRRLREFDRAGLPDSPGMAGKFAHGDGCRDRCSGATEGFGRATVSRCDWT